MNLNDDERKRWFESDADGLIEFVFEFLGEILGEVVGCLFSALLEFLGGL